MRRSFGISEPRLLATSPNSKPPPRRQLAAVPDQRSHAEGLAAAGRLDEARVALDEAIGIATRHGERFYLGELLRFKGEVSARQGRSAEAERCLDEALVVARSQRARLFELRIAATLCRTCDGSRRRVVLDTLLAPLLQSFGEADADARDVVEAAALLGAPAA